MFHCVVSIYTRYVYIISKDVSVQLVYFERLHRSSKLIDFSSRWNECVPVLNQLVRRSHRNITSLVNKKMYLLIHTCC